MAAPRRIVAALASLVIVASLVPASAAMASARTVVGLSVTSTQVVAGHRATLHIETLGGARDGAHAKVRVEVQKAGSAGWKKLRSVTTSRTGKATVKVALKASSTLRVTWGHRVSARQRVILFDAADPAAYPDPYLQSDVALAFDIDDHRTHCVITVSDGQGVYGCADVDPHFTEIAARQTCTSGELRGYQAAFAKRPAPLCGPTTVLGADRGDAALLAAGQSLTHGAVTCFSNGSSVVCRNTTTGAGFRLAPTKSLIYS